MARDAALLTAKFEDGRLELAAGGSWTAPHAAELETLVDRAAEDAAKAKAVSIDMRGVREFDTYGAWLLERHREVLAVDLREDREQAREAAVGIPAGRLR